VRETLNKPAFVPVIQDWLFPAQPPGQKVLRISASPSAGYAGYCKPSGQRDWIMSYQAFSDKLPAVFDSSKASVETWPD
jgi:hypothetical protein